MTPTSQEDWEINLKASLEGIGAILSSEDGITKIIRLIPGGPAEKSGLLKVTDKIVGVATSINEELVDVRDWRIDEVVKLIRGPKSTIVQLEVLPASSDNEDKGKLIEITRDVVKLEDAAAKKERSQYKDLQETTKSESLNCLLFIWILRPTTKIDLITKVVQETLNEY